MNIDSLFVRLCRFCGHRFENADDPYEQFCAMHAGMIPKPKPFLRPALDSARASAVIDALARRGTTP